MKDRDEDISFSYYGLADRFHIGQRIECQDAYEYGLTLRWPAYVIDIWERTVKADDMNLAFTTVYLRLAKPLVIKLGWLNDYEFTL